MPRPPLLPVLGLPAPSGSWGHEPLRPGHRGFSVYAPPCQLCFQASEPPKVHGSSLVDQMQTRGNHGLDEKYGAIEGLGESRQDPSDRGLPQQTPHKGCSTAFMQGQQRTSVSHLCLCSDTFDTLILPVICVCLFVCLFVCLGNMHMSWLTCGG